MKVFKRFVLLLWAAVLFNLWLSMIFPWYRRHVPYQVEGIIMVFALLLMGAYKTAKIYLVPLSRRAAMCHNFFHGETQTSDVAN